ncbi:type II toxin-antitoxin system RelB/DinJ family antitoxin [Deltaproteobacteria bacterium OttesenSCG-928-M10]|nr:type II toxin-antitoxin system RelB/DinJ family antitoxin [Deltaproteobacteria bacterium OttesenSCG-928-M10]
MPANGLVQARIDNQVKKEAAAVLSTIGLTVSDAVRLLLTRVAHDKALPFNPLIPNAETIQAMKEAENGPLPRFASVEALLEDLNADD